MPDLITHLAAPYAVGRLTGGLRRRPRPELALVCLGAVLPDLITRSLGVALPFTGIGPLIRPWHTPVGLVVMLLGLTFAFPERRRPAYLAWLTLGVLIHLGLDVLQIALDEGHYYWLFPFSDRSWHFGLFWSDETILFAPYLAGLALAAEGVIQYLARRRQ